MRLRPALLAAVLALIVAAAPAHAEVREATPGHFVLHNEVETTAAPEAAWRSFQRIGRWWSGDHTYSGNAANLRLDARAGGCWCEQWDRQSVEHGRVLLNMSTGEARTLRFNAPLGPLQELGVTAVLTFRFAPHNQGTKITMSYRVVGDETLGLDQLAPVVDGVLMQQLQRLKRYGDGDAVN
jgi:hypothetical protein